MRLEYVPGTHLQAQLDHYKRTRLRHDRTAVLSEAHRQRMALMMMNARDCTTAHFKALNELEKLIQFGHTQRIGSAFHEVAQRAIDALKETA